MHKLIVFDLDETLAESKKTIDKEMSELLCKLLLLRNIAVISGRKYEQFEEQIINNLSCGNEFLKNLYLFPANGSKFYRYSDGWKKIYSEDLTQAEKAKIIDSIKRSVINSKVELPVKVYGVNFGDRASQITFSACGEDCPNSIKEKWDPDMKKRIQIMSEIKKIIPEFEVRIAGMSSIDVTKKGIDKAYGIKKMMDILKIKKDEILFVGDRIFEGGNDYSVKLFGVECIQVSGPEETKKVILDILK